MQPTQLVNGLQALQRLVGNVAQGGRVERGGEATQLAGRAARLVLLDSLEELRVED